MGSLPQAPQQRGLGLCGWLGTWVSRGRVWLGLEKSCRIGLGPGGGGGSPAGTQLGLAAAGFGCEQYALQGWPRPPHNTAGVGAPCLSPAGWGHAEGLPRPDTSPWCSRDSPRSSLAPHRVSRPLGPSGGGLLPAQVDRGGSQGASKGGPCFLAAPSLLNPLSSPPSCCLGPRSAQRGEHGMGWDRTGAGRRCRLPPRSSPASPAPSQALSLCPGLARNTFGHTL